MGKIVFKVWLDNIASLFTEQHQHPCQSSFFTYVLPFTVLCALLVRCGPLHCTNKDYLHTYGPKVFEGCRTVVWFVNLCPVFLWFAEPNVSVSVHMEMTLAFQDLGDYVDEEYDDEEEDYEKELNLNLDKSQGLVS